MAGDLPRTSQRCAVRGGTWAMSDGERLLPGGQVAAKRARARALDFVRWSDRWSLGLAVACGVAYAASQMIGHAEARRVTRGADGATRPQPERR